LTRKEKQYETRRNGFCQRETKIVQRKTRGRLRGWGCMGAGTRAKVGDQTNARGHGCNGSNKCQR